MSFVAICEAPGTSASTTTSLALAAFAPPDRPAMILECDPSGGDVAGWASLHGNPSWSSAVAAPDRSWAGMHRHLQELPSGLSVMLAPSSPANAETVVGEAAERLGPVVAALDEVVGFADCGRTTQPTAWIAAADLVIVLVRQATSAGASVPRVDRAGELAKSLPHRTGVGLVVVGERPYAASDIATSVGLPLLGVLPDDGPGAALAAGAWTVGRGAARTPLARSARVVSEAILDALHESGRSTPMVVQSMNGARA